MQNRKKMGKNREIFCNFFSRMGWVPTHGIFNDRENP